jgi:hypothetical protein
MGVCSISDSVDSEILAPQMKTAVVLVRWRRSQIAETFASVRVSAPCYRFAENIGFIPIVKPELKFRQVQRQIFLAHVVIRADNSALQQRPEGINAASVNLAANVLARRMRDGSMRHRPAEIAVSGVLIGRYQFHFVADNLPHESGQRLSIGMFDHLADHVALSADCADHWRLASGSALIKPLVGVLVLFLAADIRLVNFHDSHQLPELRIAHPGAQAMAHIPSRPIRTGTDHPMNLHRADSLLARQHQVQNLEPYQQRIFAFLEDRSRLEREAIRCAIVLAALLALPMRHPDLARVDVIVLAARASDAVRPAARVQIFAAGILVRKHGLELADSDLSDDLRFRLFPLVVLRHNRNYRRFSHGSQQRHTSLWEGVRG